MLDTLFSWLHLAAATVWIGGLVFMLVVLRANTPVFIEAAMAFRPWIWGAMTAMVLSGIYRIVELGGMRALPVVLHIKITLALVMILISLGTSLALLPRAAANPETPPTLYIWGNTVVVVLGLAIYWMLVASGLL